MTTTPYIFEELAELLASMNPEKVIAFHTSPKSQKQVEQLLLKNKNISGLSEAEKTELEQFMLVEQIVGLAKAKALKKIQL